MADDGPMSWGDDITESAATDAAPPLLPTPEAARPGAATIGSGAGAHGADGREAPAGDRSDCFWFQTVGP